MNYTLFESCLGKKLVFGYIDHTTASTFTPYTNIYLFKNRDTLPQFKKIAYCRQYE